MVETIATAAYIPPPVPAASGFQNRSGNQQRPGRQHRNADSAIDLAAVFSLPDDVLPPALQDIFLQLVEQVERLRDEVERVRHHEEFLLNAADRHVFLPALNRRAFLTGLTRVLDASARADLPGNLAFLHVEGIEVLRGAHGLAAGDAALVFVATAIQDELRESDLFAYLDGSDFAIALTVAESEGVAKKLGRLISVVTNSPLMWGKTQVSLDLKVGLVAFRPGVPAGQLLSEASQAMISGTSALSI